MGVLEELEGCDENTFPAINFLVHVLTTLRQPKTILRTQTVEDGVNNCLVSTYIHRHTSININKVINRFAKSNNRKIDLMF